MKNRARRLNTLGLIHVCAALIFALSAQDVRAADTKARLPTGAWLDTAGRSFDVGNMPLAILPSPDGRYLILSLSGWREQGVQVFEVASGKVVQTLAQPSAFLGLAFSPDGRTLYASGGNEDAVFRYGWSEGRLTLADKIALAEKDPKKDGTRFPSGLAVSSDGRTLYVAENIADSLAVVDLQSKRVVERHKTDHYPYAVVSAGSKVYASAWGGDSVNVFGVKPDGTLADEGKTVVGRHPSALALSPNGSRLFVASASTDSVVVLDTKTRRIVARLEDSPPGGSREGSTPDALALSTDGSRLFVAEADNNSIAVFDLGRETSGDSKQPARRDALAGRIPCGWYPTAVVATREALFVLNGKGSGTRANPSMRQPGERLADGSKDYTLGQLDGTVNVVSQYPSAAELRAYTRRVTAANNWASAQPARKYPPFKHVVYVIKENRTYDQMFGDVKEGDGDPSLLFFTRDANPNHRALAARFGLFDRFFVNAEVSQQGHPWTTSAYVTDYTEKTTPTLYSNRRASPDDEGETDEPSSGFLWDAAIKKGVTLRNYGEYCSPIETSKDAPAAPQRYRPSKAALVPYTNADYPSFDMNITDQTRIEVWLKEFREFVSKGEMPALEIMHLPGDHTSGGRAGRRTPRAYVADNDLALGRMVEALSRTKFWRDTVFFVLEDDAQDGPDHVDSHRSVLLVVSAYNRGGTLHRFVNTTDVVATVEEILGLAPLSQFDRFGRPLREIFSTEPDLRPYVAEAPRQPLNELNPASGTAALDSERLDLSKEDVADMDLFNRVLWRAIKGEGVPYPSAKSITTLDYIRGR